MKAHYYETAGVHLGWAIPTGDGFIFRNDKGVVEWLCGYVTNDAGHTVVDPHGWLTANRRFEMRSMNS